MFHIRPKPETGSPCGFRAIPPEPSARSGGTGRASCTRTGPVRQSESQPANGKRFGNV
jgi:hypothetical protein